MHEPPNTSKHHQPAMDLQRKRNHQSHWQFPPDLMKFLRGACFDGTTKPVDLTPHGRWVTSQLRCGVKSICKHSHYPRMAGRKLHQQLICNIHVRRTHKDNE